MSLRILPFLAAACLIVPLTGCVARGAARITNVIPLQLQEGANLVPHLAPDGRQGLVVEGRQPMARAPLIMTMLPRTEGARGWDVVQADGPDGVPGPTIDARGRSVVFARAKVGGMPATLLFVAQPDASDPAPSGEPRRIVIRTLRLNVDEASARFRSIGTETTSRRYCSASDAIAVTYRMALREDDGASDRCSNPAT